MTILLYANSLFALAALSAALLALFRPEKMIRTNQATENEKFYANMYAARAIPAAILTLLAPWLWQGLSVFAILLAAALMQIADAWIGWQKREWGMVIAPLCAATTHICTLIAYL